MCQLIFQSRQGAQVCVKSKLGACQLRLKNKLGSKLRSLKYHLKRFWLSDGGMLALLWMRLPQYGNWTARG